MCWYKSTEQSPPPAPPFYPPSPIPSSCPPLPSPCPTILSPPGGGGTGGGDRMVGQEERNGRGRGRGPPVPPSWPSPCPLLPPPAQQADFNRTVEPHSWMVTTVSHGKKKMWSGFTNGWQPEVYIFWCIFRAAVRIFCSPEQEKYVALGGVPDMCWS